MISQINITVNAAKPKFPLVPMVAFNGSPSSIRISGVPCSIGNWSINSVRVLVSYPNNFTVEKTAVKVDNFWIATIDGSQTNGFIKNGFQILADGIDENNEPVAGYVLGVGDVVVLERDQNIEKLVDRYAVRYLNEPPVNPSTGDLLNLNGKIRLWDGSRWISLGGDEVLVYDSTITIQKNGAMIGSFTVNSQQNKTINIPVPSNVSELNNDVGYITASQVPAVPSNLSDFNNDVGFITESAVPSKTSELENDSGFVTASAIPSKVSELQNDSGFITASQIPAIPSKVSELDNDSGFITLAAIPSNISAFNNDVGYLSAVTWNDVSGKPNIPSNTSDLVNDSGFITANDIPAIPSKTSDLDNDSGFITASAIPSQISSFENDVGFITASAIPSNVSAFNNDVGYITASQVVPATAERYVGYAQNARNAARMYNEGYTNNFVDETTYLEYYRGRLRNYSNKYYPWSLSYYNGTTFDPPYELVFEYVYSVVLLIGGRPRTVSINSYCWIYNPNNTTLYYIPCTDHGVLTGTMGIGTSSYPITLSQDNLSIETINGQSGNITCTRASTYPLYDIRYIAYEDQIPSAVSQLTNDVGYVTASAIPSNTSDLNNDSGFITASAIPSNVGAFTNDVGYVTASAIPSNVSDLNNDAGYVTASTVAASYYNKTEIDGIIGSINTILDNINGEVI